MNKKILLLSLLITCLTPFYFIVDTMVGTNVAYYFSIVEVFLFGGILFILLGFFNSHSLIFSIIFILQFLFKLIVFFVILRLLKVSNIKNKKNIIIIVSIILITQLIGYASFYLYSPESRANRFYNNIKEGMTYDEVIKIQESTVSDFSVSPRETVDKVTTWYANGVPSYDYCIRVSPKLNPYYRYIKACFSSNNILMQKFLHMMQ